MEEAVEIPNDYIIRFANEEVKLEYVGECDGIFKYEKSYTSVNKVKGDKSKLTITVDYSFLTETERLFYGVKIKPKAE